MATIIQPTNQDNNELLDEDLIPMPAIAPSQSAAPSTPPPASDPAPLSSPPQDDLIGAPVEADPEPAVTAPAPRSEAEAGEYDDIKLKALTELRPLIDEVDLPPEQKFHTILEIISATNDKELIPKLFESAEKIEDKHERAEALIDVVSEIQYLTDPK